MPSSSPYAAAAPFDTEEEGALAAFRKVIEIAPISPVEFNNIGNIYRKRGDLDRAMEAYREALRCDAQYIGAYNNLGLLDQEAASDERSPYQCDGRVYCSQMTSCEEAEFFLANCPGVKMDGGGDSVPCAALNNWVPQPVAWSSTG